MDLLKKMEIYAQENYVPIARKANIDYLKKIIEEEKLYDVLELGSAIGYSAICMASVCENVRVTTIERNEVMYREALKNIDEAQLGNRIKIIFDDVFNVELDDKKYDLIFIDAAKAQYIKFFEKFSPLLKDNGVIISDNIELLDLQRMTDSKRSRKLIEKMHNYKEYLLSLKDYKSEFLSIGDGFAITRKIIN
jgi:predicted O-methyltransferase YrrM